MKSDTYIFALLAAASIFTVLALVGLRLMGGMR